MKKFYAFASALIMAGAILGGMTSCIKSNNTDAAKVAGGALTEGESLPIAFIQADSLYNNYQLQIDLTQDLVQKKAQAEDQVNKQMAAFQKEYQDFMQKVQTNSFIGGQSRMESEQRRLQQKQATIEQHANALQQDLALLQSQAFDRVNDSIQAVLKEYNKDKNFEVIYSSVPNTTVFFVKNKYDITQEVLDLLNKRYAEGKKSE
ncbi:MAG: OmpH family outer membrane protein [Bacteroidales bacterium]|nr:OmpH family outer membrane protein [Bacteroidales bacterium]